MAVHRPRLRPRPEAPLDRIVSPIKLWKAGFADCEDTEDAILHWLARMQRDRLLPRVRPGRPARDRTRIHDDEETSTDRTTNRRQVRGDDQREEAHAAGLSVLRELGWPADSGFADMDPKFWAFTTETLFGRSGRAPG